MERLIPGLSNWYNLKPSETLAPSFCFVFGPTWVVNLTTSRTNYHLQYCQLCGKKVFKKSRYAVPLFRVQDRFLSICIAYTSTGKRRDFSERVGVHTWAWGLINDLLFSFVVISGNNHSKYFNSLENGLKCLSNVCRFSRICVYFSFNNKLLY